MRRLVLARTFLVNAKLAAKKPYDENALALATINLHDAADNLLGAVCSSTGANPNSSLIVTYQDLKKTGVVLTHHAQIKNLNTYRNNIKHQGIIPNSKDITALVPDIVDFCETTCQTVFGIPLSKASRKELITDLTVKTEVEAIEASVDGGDFKQAMFDSATVLFTRFTDKYLMVWRLSSIIESYRGGGKKSKYETTFPNGIARDLHIDLLEIGIDPYLYHRFSNLTPEVGYSDLQTKELVYKKNGEYWHSGNWTEENALFCLNFLIDALISQQKEYGGYTITSRRITHKIKFLRNTQALDYKHEPYKNYLADTEMECKLLNYADGEFQPGRSSELGLTEVMIELGAKADIILMKPEDISVINETYDTESVNF